MPIVYPVSSSDGGGLPDLGVGYVRSLGGGDFTVVTTIPVTHGGTGLASFSVGDTIYCSASNVLTRLAGNATTDRMFLSQLGDGVTPDAPSWVTLVADDVGLGNVENTALSTWAGSTNIVTVGTITTGEWNGSQVDDAYIASAATWNNTSDVVALGSASWDDAYTLSLAAEPAIAAGTTAQYWRGDKSWQTLDKSAVGLSNVENTALSTWAGSTNITTLGTVTSGTWNGAAIGDSYISSATTWNAKLSDTLADGKIFVGNAGNVATAVTMSGDATLSNTGALTLANVVSAGSAGAADKTLTITVDAKGRITAFSAGSIAITESQVTGLVSDLAGKEPTITAGTTAQYWRGDKSWQTLNKAAVGLGNVENTALSTWAGTTNLTTAGDLNVNELNVQEAGTSGDLAISYLNSVGFFFPGPTDMAFVSGGSERWRIVSTGAMIFSATTTYAVTATVYTPMIHVHGTGLGASHVVSRWSADAVGPAYVLTKSRGATVGSFDAVHADDELGRFVATGDDGADLQNASAGMRIYAAEAFTTTAQGTYVDIYTTTKLGTTSTRRLRVHDNGVVAIGNTSTNYVSNLPSSVVPLLQANGTGAGGGSAVIGLWSSSVTSPATLYLIKSRSGTVGTQGAISSGDIIGRVQVIGDDGTDFSTGQNRLEWGAVENFSSGAKGAYFDLWVTPATTSTPVRAFRVFDSGRVGFNTTTDDGTYRLQVAGPLKTTGSIFAGSRSYVNSDTQITGPNSVSAFLQVNGDNGNTSAIAITNFQATTGPATLQFLKSRNATIGSHTALNSGDFILRIEANGSDGTDFSTGRNRVECTATENYDGTHKGAAWDFYATPLASTTAVRAVRFESNGMTLLGTATVMATPASGYATFGARTIGSKQLLASVDPDGFETILQSSLGLKHHRVVLVGTGTTATTIVTAYGFAFTVSATTYAQNTPTTGSLKSRTRSCQFATSTAAGNVAYLRGNVLECARETGFFFVDRTMYEIHGTNTRSFIGLVASVANPTNVDPTTSTALARCGFCFNGNTGSGGKYWNFVTCNGTNITATDFGASFPVNTTDLYEFRMTCAPSGSAIYYEIRNLSTGALATGSHSTNLPGNTSFMTIHKWISNNDAAANCNISHIVTYLETEY